MKQSDLFLESEGDAFYERNRDKPRLPDPVLDAMAELKLQPKTVLELGCGNGWRLAEIEKLYKPTHLAGYDPSEMAVKQQVFPKAFARVFRADATILQKIRASSYDTIIFGFCLYLVDREDLMMIAAHADRVLKDGGHIIIHDFIDGPYKTPYKHKEGVWSYHMDHSHLWFGHPAYLLISRRKSDDQIGVVVIRKDLANAFPEKDI